MATGPMDVGRPRKILVGWDCSPGAAAALRAVAALAADGTAAVVVLAVIKPAAHTEDTAEGAADFDECMRFAQKTFAKAREGLPAALRERVSLRFAESGHDADTVCEYARQHEAGVTERATGTRDMDRLGGLIHRLPRSAVIAFAGTLGIAALPPLNGFVSEWLIFQGLFQGFRTGSHLTGILIVLAAGTLGLTGGLAVYAFVRGFGIPYLGMPRTRQAAEASERGQPVLGPALLAVACVALAVGAPVVLFALARMARTVTGVTLGPLLLPGNLTVIPAHADFAAFSPTYLTVFGVCALAVPLLIYLAGRPRARSTRVPVWDGGIVSFKPRMQYSAMTFSAPTRVTFDALYRPSVSVTRPSDDDPAGRSGPVHYEVQVTPAFHRYLYRPLVRGLEWLADLVRPVQSGDVNLYLLYVFAVILLAYLLGAV